MTEKRPLTSVAYTYVYNNIINGAFTVNDVLSEGHLAEQLNMSKAPVREALVALCTEGILRSIPRMGYQVIQIMPFEVQEMYDARLLLETSLLKKTFARVTEAQIRELEDYLAFAKADYLVHNTVLECWERNSRFHLLLASLGGNQYLLRMLEQTFKSCARATTQYFIQKVLGQLEDPPSEYHIEIVDCLKTGDRERALSLIERDVYLTLDGTMLDKPQRNEIDAVG